MNKFIRRAAIVACLALGVTGLTVGSASAHTDRSNVTCQRLHVDLQAYSNGANRVDVLVDGQSVEHSTFSRSLVRDYAFNQYVSHDVVLKVDASDSSRYDVNRSWKTTACPKPTQPPADRETRSLPGSPDCKAGTVTTYLQERVRPHDVWDGDSWEPGSWSAWVTTSTSVVPTTIGQCPPSKIFIRVKMIDKCNCWRDSVKALGGKHVTVKVTRPSRLHWNVRAVADKDYVLPSRINGHRGWERIQNYPVTLTAKPCPKLHPHPNLPPHPVCRGCD